MTIIHLKLILLIFATTLSFYMIANMHPDYVLGQTPDLTGVWASNDGGTYYIKQIENDILWFGKSNADPPSFANVFHGTLKDSSITGIWADVPLGSNQNHGTLTLQIQNDGSLSKTAMTGGFFGSNFYKLQIP